MSIKYAYRNNYFKLSNVSGQKEDFPKIKIFINEMIFKRTRKNIEEYF